MSETEERPQIPDPAAHHLFRIDREVLMPFFEQVPKLFESEQSPVHDAYQACLYRTEHNFQVDDLERIEAHFKLSPAEWGTVHPDGVIERLDAAKYPDTTVVALIEAVPGLSLETVSHYLHFFHHTYPMFTKAALKGLAKLGIDIPWTLVRDAEIYGLYIAALDELKDRIPFWCVPEQNVHLTRILQAALAAYARA